MKGGLLPPNPQNLKPFRTHPSPPPVPLHQPDRVSVYFLAPPVPLLLLPRLVRHHHLGRGRGGGHHVRLRVVLLLGEEGFEEARGLEGPAPRHAGVHVLQKVIDVTCRAR